MIRGSNWTIGNNPTPEQLKKYYEDGFPGAPFNPVEYEGLFENNIVRTGIDIEHLVRTNPGNGKRALLWRSREKYDPGAFSDIAQKRGDCVSFGDMNARDVTRAVEIHIKGESEEYYKRGATEPTYGYRGHRGEGMDPARAAKFVTQYGWMVRQKYDGCVDLTTYNSRLVDKWGSKGPPDCVLEKCAEHPVGEYLVPETPDQAISLLQNGYACHSGQNLGFADNPDARGIHKVSGRWNHDMATVGYDDTKQIYQKRVYFVANSWGVFNNQWFRWSEFAHIMGPPVDGLITVDGDVWEEYFLGGGSIYFYSDIKGFPAKNLPDYGTTSYL